MQPFRLLTMITWKSIRLLILIVLNHALKHGRTFLHSAIEELVCSGHFGQGRLCGSLAVTRSDSESIFQQQFGEYHGYDGFYSIYFDSSPIVRLSGLLQKSRMTILGPAGVLFCENEQA